MTRKIARVLLVFYLTAPLFGAYVAVAVCLVNAWGSRDPFLAAAAVSFGLCATAAFVLVLWVVRRL
jgi:hypothetical protein